MGGRFRHTGVAADRGISLIWGRIMRIVLLVVLLVAVSGCGGVIVGTPQPAPSDPAGATTSPVAPVVGAGDGRPELPEPVDGSGFSSEPLDQPPSIPGMFWHGWSDACAWIDPTLAAAFGATGAGTPHNLGCTLPLTAPVHMQLAWLRPFHAMSGAALFVRPITIAGQQARQFALPAMDPNGCALQVHSRSTTTLHVVVWNPDDPTGPDREAHCTTAAAIAEAAITRFVPAAGGTPWPGTPQTPSAAVLDGATACQIATTDVASLANLDRTDGTPGTSELGSTCHYTSDYASAEVLLATQDLADVPTYSPGARTINQKLVGLPARMEHTDDDCAVVVALADHVTVRITYRIDQPGSSALACRYAETMTATAVGTLLNRS